jgi:hypothetical protein
MSDVPFYDGPYSPALPAPVVIDGTDPSLATEILPAPPPLSFVRTPLNKRPGDFAKRPLPSFLPSSDPGTTYATHGVVAPSVVVGGTGIKPQALGSMGVLPESQNHQSITQDAISAQAEDELRKAKKARIDAKRSEPFPP